MRRDWIALPLLLFGSWPVAAEAQVYRFQFAPAGAPSSEGFVSITEKDRYAPGKPGWLDGPKLAAAQRKRGAPLARSFVYGYTTGGRGDGSFKLELANGAYRVVMFFEDLDYARADTPFDVYANGEPKLSAVAVVGVVLKSFQTEVRDGQLTLRFAPSPVAKRYNFWLINALMIAPEAQGDAAETALARLVHEVVPRKDFTEAPPPVTANPAEPTATDRARGYQLWCHSYLDLVYPSTLPPAGLPDPRLKTFACPRQTTCLAFSVRALEDLGAPRVEVKASAAQSLQPQVKVERVWVRPVRDKSHGTKYTNRPDALLPLAGVKLSSYWFVDYRVAANTSQTYWLTISVPPKTPAGPYQATIEFRPEGRPAAHIPLTIAVLPLELPEPPQYTGVYWYRSHMAYPDLVEKDLAGMYAHGVRAAAISARVAATLEGDMLKLDCDELLRDLELVKKAGLTGEMPCSCGSLLHIGGKQAVTDAALDERFALAVAEVNRQVEQRGLPHLLWYPVDEPGNNPERLAAAKRYLSAAKRAPGARTYCTPNSIAAVRELRSLMDVACIQQLSMNEQTAAEVRASGGTVYFYTSAYDGDRLPDRLRFLNGRFLFKSGARAIFYWHYQYPVGDPLNDLDGETCDYNLCHPSANGPISTLGWEAIREGNNDVAFFHCLKQWIGQAESSTRPEAKAAAAEAQKWLTGMLDAFPLDGKLVHQTVSPSILHEAYDRDRWQAAQHMMRLMELLGRLSPEQKATANAMEKDD